MTSQELLELAAYAVGLKGEFGEKFSIGTSEVDCTDLFFIDDDSHCAVWNPLTNKADAFDLMVKLRLSVDVGLYDGELRVSAGTLLASIADEPIANNPEAATMLAITRAAAAIGKQMKESGQ